jgi:NAD-reducing hydrogenase large subunit
LGKTITIDPVTRIEGHAKITLVLDDAGRVADARFHVTELRGFEAFCVGRHFLEMPAITARICGICPVSHSLASSLAGDRILGVDPPPAAKALRRLLTLAQLLQSHALSFFHLSAPDLLLGMDAPPGERNLAGLIRKHPDVAKDGIRLRAIGQSIIRTLAGQSVHPPFIVPGGVLAPLPAEARDRIASMAPEGRAIVLRAIDLLQAAREKLGGEISEYGDSPALFLGTVDGNGTLEHVDGLLRMVDATGGRVVDDLPTDRYGEILGEEMEPWSYMKFPYLHAPGIPAGRAPYRVGPLARLNACDRAGTPLADRELARFKALGDAGRPVAATFHYHYARLVEMLHALERIEAVGGDAAIAGTDVRAGGRVRRSVGIGACEAPRGTLFHEYHVDPDGILLRVKLLVATSQNNRAINEAIRLVADKRLSGGRLTEGALNRIEHAVRLYDPCLSCATHAIGPPALRVRLVDIHGTLLEERS